MILATHVVPTLRVEVCDGDRAYVQTWNRRAL